MERQGFDESIVQNLSLDPQIFVGGTAVAAGNAEGQGDEDEFDSPFIVEILSAANRVLNGIESADFRVREHFQQAMWFLVSHGVSEAEVASAFCTSTSAVNRWTNGRSAPTPVMRAAVVMAAVSYFKRDGVLVAGRRFDLATGLSQSQSGDA